LKGDPSKLRGEEGQKKKKKKKEGGRGRIEDLSGNIGSREGRTVEIKKIYPKGMAYSNTTRSKRKKALGTKRS